ncbi:MAG: biotin/lipoyl-binding protein [Chloroflexota bacterium]|nr:MAG: biotin/lipoyl-binding protein [Chloroflexota bacterium]
MKYVTTINDREFIVEIIDEKHVVVDGVAYEVDFEPVGDQPVFSLLLDGQSFEAHVYPEEEGWQVRLHGVLYSALVEDERERRLRAAMGSRVTDHGEYHLRSPMPGLVVSIPVPDGQAIEKGDVLLIWESMKMQNELRSPRAGAVARIRVQPGDSVEQKQTLLSVV